VRLAAVVAAAVGDGGVRLAALVAAAVVDFGGFRLDAVVAAVDATIRDVRSAVVKCSSIADGEG